MCKISSGGGRPNVSTSRSRDYYERSYDRGYDRYDDREYYKSYRFVSRAAVAVSVVCLVLAILIVVNLVLYYFCLCSFVSCVYTSRTQLYVKVWTPLVQLHSLVRRKWRARQDSQVDRLCEQTSACASYSAWV